MPPKKATAKKPVKKTASKTAKAEKKASISLPSYHELVVKALKALVC